MTFSEFATLLFPYIGGNQRRDEFVVGLVRHIMKEPVLTEDKKLEKDGKYIPLPREMDSLCRIFSGTRSVSAKSARGILSKLDKERFELYINDFPNDTLTRIKSSFQNNGIDISDEEGQIGSICANLFVSILEDCASKKRSLGTMTPQNQSPEIELDIAQVTPIDMTTAGVMMPAETGQPLIAGSSDGINDISLQERAGIEQRPRGTNTSEIENETGFEDEEEQQLPDLSKPMFFREYRQQCLKMFEMYTTWNPEPLDPELKEKWESASITDEFYKNIKDYGIEKFMDIAPSDLLPMKKVITGVDVINRVKSAVRFVGYMEPSIDHMLISNENKEIFNAISNYVVLLRRYLNFLRENSNNPDLFSDEFVLIPSGDNELEQKANMYYSKLQTLYKQITR